MKIGIVGFPLAGKTTVFNALTGLAVSVGGYGDPAKPNLGTIKVPDERVDRLSEIYQPRKSTCAEIVFIDIPGAADRSATALERGTIAQMRDVDALVQVVRAFEDPLTGDPPDPGRHIDDFKSELLLADLAIVEKRLERVRKERGPEREIELLDRCQTALESDLALRQIDLSETDLRSLSGFGLLSRLPLLVVLNVSEKHAAEAVPAPVQKRLDRDGVAGLALCAQFEMEVAALEPEERVAFLKDLGLERLARDRFVRATYELLDLVCFLTTGKDEVRAWPIRRGTIAVKAAGKVHTDIERGFIRAEVVSYADFLRYGSEAKCREAGKYRLEGKEYVVEDGDIVHFRFNV